MKVKSTTQTTISYSREEIIQILRDMAARTINTMGTELAVELLDDFTVTFTYTSTKGDPNDRSNAAPADRNLPTSNA